MNRGYGYWSRATSEATESVSDGPPNAANLNPPEEETPAAEREIGDGNESVYVYFNPNDRELALLKGRTVWECKIGSTGITDVLPRIQGQGTKTALSHPPVIGLIIRTSDSAAMEKALHASLRLIDAQVPDSIGTEWFMTSPERIKKWFAAFQHALWSLNDSDKRAEQAAGPNHEERGRVDVPDRGSPASSS